MATPAKGWTVTFSGANRAATEDVSFSTFVRRGQTIALADPGFGALHGVAALDGWSLSPGSLASPATKDYTLGATITPAADMTLYPHYAATSVAAWDSSGDGIVRGATFRIGRPSQYGCCSDAAPYVELLSDVAAEGRTCLANYQTSSPGGHHFTLALSPGSILGGWAEGGCLATFQAALAAGATKGTFRVHAGSPTADGNLVAEISPGDGAAGAGTANETAPVWIPDGTTLYIAVAIPWWGTNGLTVSKFTVR